MKINWNFQEKKERSGGPLGILDNRGARKPP